MARKNRDGNTIRRVLEYALRRGMTDAELAAALGMSPAKYSRHKDDDGFPSFEQLGQLADHFNLSATVLRYDFGYLGSQEFEELHSLLLEDDGPPVIPLAKASRKEARTTTAITRRRLKARTDIPAL